MKKYFCGIALKRVELEALGGRMSKFPYHYQFKACRFYKMKIRSY